MLTLSRRRTPVLAGRTVVVLGGGTELSREIARHARAEGADVVLTTFDAGDQHALQRFFDELPAPVDHVVVPAGEPQDVSPLAVARSAVGSVRAGGSLVFGDSTGGQRQLTRALAVALAPIRVRVALVEPVAAEVMRALAQTSRTAATDDVDNELLAEAV